MGTALKKLTIRGFKSIENLQDFEMRPLNVLIGANGSGKSNFVDFFRMLRVIADEGLQKFINVQGGGDGFFFLGPKQTPQITAHMEFGDNIYEFDLIPASNGSVQISEERVLNTGKGICSLRPKPISSGFSESLLKHRATTFGQRRGEPGFVYDSISNWTVYHFHDTSMLAPMRRDQSVRDYERLRHDASNIAAFLMHMKQHNEGAYRLIRDTVRLIAPFFDDFLLRPEERGGNEVVRLEWQQKGSDFPFQPNQLSDGTIRFICLTTALLQPCLPAMIVIDEPELGLHPYAISMIADLIKSASERTQVVICTQSPILLDHFEPEDLITVNREQGHSTFDRLEPNELDLWIDEYSVGELWQKNVIRGGPTHG